MTPSPSTAILIVDDQPIVVELLKRMLASMGLPEVDSAADGWEALSAMRERRYGLIIADINMAPMTGLQMLRAIRSDPALKHVPVLMMTASKLEELHEEARQARVNGYLLKPFTAQTLREAILRILAVWGGAQPGAAA